MSMHACACVYVCVFCLFDKGICLLDFSELAYAKDAESTSKKDAS